jgi:hypothetical protein
MFRPMMAIIGRRPTLQWKRLTCMLPCTGYGSTLSFGEPKHVAPNTTHTRPHTIQTVDCEGTRPSLGFTAGFQLTENVINFNKINI